MLPIYISAILDDPKDEAIFEEFMKKHEPTVIKLAYSMCKSQALAEEVSQEVFFSLARVFRKLNLGDEQKTKGIVITTTAFRAKDALRKEKKHFGTVNIDEIEFCVGGRNLEEEIVSSDSRSRIIDCITKIPDIYRDTLHLYFGGEMSTREIADIIGEKHSTVKSRLQRGTKILREIIKREGLYD